MYIVITDHRYRWQNQSQLLPFHSDVEIGCIMSHFWMLWMLDAPVYSYFAICWSHKWWLRHIIPMERGVTGWHIFLYMLYLNILKGRVYNKLIIMMMVLTHIYKKLKNLYMIPALHMQQIFTKLEQYWYVYGPNIFTNNACATVVWIAHRHSGVIYKIRYQHWYE